MRDVINQSDEKIAYLHFDYLYPLKTEALLAFIEKYPHACIIEGNATGQFA